MTALATEYAEHDDTSAPSGVLAGDGSALLRLVVNDRPVPAEPPSWAAAATPVRDPHGHTYDWRLPGDAGGPDSADHDRFQQWRLRFLTERVVTDIATVRAFLDWADRHVDVTTLHALARPFARIEAQHLQTAVWQATHASAVCRARREQGLAVFSAERVGVVRGFATVNGPVPVLDDGTVSAVAHRDRIALRGDDLGELDVREWLLDGDAATIGTPDGKVTVSDPAIARLLRQIAPGVEQAVLRPAPLTRLFAPLFVDIPEMARLAATGHASLVATWDHLPARNAPRPAHRPR